MPARAGQKEAARKRTRHAAQRYSSPQHRHHTGAPFGRREFAGEADKIGAGTAQTQPREQTTGKKNWHRSGQRRAQRAQREQAGADQQHAFAAMPITQRAEKECADQEADLRSGESGPHGSGGHAQLASDGGRGGGDGLRIKAVEKGDERAAYQYAPSI
jgi:hypothetical protein